MSFTAAVGRKFLLLGVKNMNILNTMNLLMSNIGLLFIFIYVYSSVIAMLSDILLKLYICTKLLEVEGVYGLLNIESLSFNLLPIDKDIITMELDFFYTSYFLVS